MATKETATEAKKRKALHVEVVSQMLTLATSGFGLVAALAWNSLIQEFINSYVKKWLPTGSGILSLFIYAAAITCLAVLVTLQLSRLKERLENK
jgi:hypothetical protein